MDRLTTTIFAAIACISIVSRDVSAFTPNQLLLNKANNGCASIIQVAAVSPEDLFASPTQNSKKKKKKNKYAKFSKADKVEKDPLEQLMEESEEKVKAIKTEAAKKRIRVVPVSPEANKRLEFPNNKDIDPYDPTTFGYIEIGTVQGAHGVHGWVKVQGYTDFPERLTKAGMPLHIKSVRKRAPRKITLAAGKETGVDAFLVQFQGVYNRTEAEKLRGASIYYATQQDTVVQEEDLIVSDLVGLEVYTDDEEMFVGTIKGIVLAEEMCAVPGLGQDMLEVAIHKPKSDQPTGRPVPDDLVLIPFVPEIVPKVDLEERKIVIDPPPGLLDLTYIREEKVVLKGLLPPAKD